MVKVTYDREAKILLFHLSSKKSIDSDVQDNVVVDRDKDGNIVNIEIMDIGIDQFKRAQPYMGKARLPVFSW